MRWTTFLIVYAAAFAQETPTAKQILQKVRDTYTGVRPFEIAGSFEMIDADASRPLMTVPFRIAAEYPDKLRIEGQAGLIPRGATQAGTLISDGKITWAYDANRHAYTKKSGSPKLDLDMDDHELHQMGIQPSSSDAVKIGESLLFMFRKIADPGDRATLLRTENLHVGAAQAECYVVEAQDGPGKPKNTIWIERDRFRIRRLDAVQVQSVQGKAANVIMRLSFPTVTLNEPLPDSTFSFVPPADAKQVEELR